MAERGMLEKGLHWWEKKSIIATVAGVGTAVALAAMGFASLATAAWAVTGIEGVQVVGSHIGHRSLEGKRRAGGEELYKKAA